MKLRKDKFEFIEKEKIYNNKKLVLSEDHPRGFISFKVKG